MQRCRRCILPHSYAGITFDDNGICSYCREWRKPQYEDERKLVELIKEHKGNSRYDCAIGFSGGRDSTYLLFYASQVLKLKVIGFTIDNGYMSAQAIRNVKNLAGRLGVEVVVRKHNYLRKAFPDNLRSWLKRPEPALLLALCNGCRYGYSKGIYQMMKEYGVRVYLDGDNPFEKNPYKTQLLSLNPKSRNRLLLLAGAVRHILQNPAWIIKPYSAYLFYSDYVAYIGKKYRRKMEKEGRLFLSPFHNYIRWNEQTVNATLEKELNWIQNRHSTSTWRTDCRIGPLKQYLGRKTLDYTDHDGLLSALVRDGQLTREEALARVSGENGSNPELIRGLLEETGIADEEVARALAKVGG